MQRDLVELYNRVWIDDGARAAALDRIMAIELDDVIMQFDFLGGAVDRAFRRAELQISRGTGAAVGKVGLSEEASARPLCISRRSESQQNCAGLGAEWGIPPAGKQLAAKAAGTPAQPVGRTHTGAQPLALTGLRGVNSGEETRRGGRGESPEHPGVDRSSGTVKSVDDARINSCGTLTEDGGEKC